MAKKKGGGGANWMDTYGDMVTLLLCFFVLLYSMSTIDTDKWKALVMSFNPNAIPGAAVPTNAGNDGPSADPPPADPTDEPHILTEAEKEEQQDKIEEALMELYEKLQEYVQQSASAAQIDISRGDGYVYISFNEAVFFNPNKWDLLPAGEVILTDIAQIMNGTAEYIDEIKVMGHTAQANINRPNYTLEDRLISASRAAVASAFLQDNAGNIEPARIISEGFGMHRGIASNKTEEGKRINRRVEILVSGKNVYDELGDSLDKYELIAGGNPNTDTGTTG